MEEHGSRRVISIVLLALLLFSIVLIIVPDVEVAADDPIPSSFDLRATDGYDFVSEVKSQQGGTCWTHGTMSAMESNLIMTGLWETVENSTLDPDLAEYHLDWWNGFNDHNNDDRAPPNGSGLVTHYGGDYLVSAAYLSRGDGAVRDKDGQFFEDPPERSLPQYHRYYPKHIEWYQMDDELNGIDEIKQAVIDYGAMGTCMNADPNLRDDTHAHYQPPNDDRPPNHAVAIVGWDDNKTTPAPEPGAWLIKNSWGSLWGNEGYFWISYYDKWAAKHPEMGAVSFRDVSYLTFDHALYHDYHGWRDTWTNSTEAFNRFIVEEDEQLHGVSFYTTEDDVSVRISIWDDYAGGELVNRIWTGTETYHKTGLHTIMFENPLGLYEGDDIHIKLNVSRGGIAYDRTSIVPVLLGPTRDAGDDSWITSFSAPNQSFYRNGSKWDDLYYQNESANFCIKGLVGHASIISPRDGEKVGSRYTAKGPVSPEIDKVVLQIDGGELIPTIIRYGEWSVEFFDLSLTHGLHTMKITATQDGCRDIVFTTHTEFIFDTNDPVSWIILNGTEGDNGWFISEVEVGLEAWDATSEVEVTEYRLDGGPWTEYNGTFIVEDDGVHEVKYRSLDIAGNLEGTKDQEIKIDKVSPMTDFMLSGDKGESDWYISPVTLHFVSYDGTSKVSGVELWIDGNKEEYDPDDPPIVSANGEHEFTYFAVDMAGNPEEPESETFVMDMEDPITDLVVQGEIGNNGWHLSPVSISLQASDGYSGVKASHYRVVGGSWGVYSTPVSFNKDGKFVVEYHSEDLAGHTEKIRNQMIKIDTESPVTNGILEGVEGNDPYYLDEVTILLEPSDSMSGIDGTFWRLDEGALRGYRDPIIVTDSGIHVISFYSVDRAGNIEDMKWLIFEIDLWAPVAILEERLNGKVVNSTSIDLHPFGMDPDGHDIVIQYAFDDQGWYHFSSSDQPDHDLEAIVLSELGEGLHVLHIRITDAAGRSSNYNFEFQMNSSLIVDNSEKVVEDDPSNDGNAVGWFLPLMIIVVVIFLLGVVGLVFLWKRPS